MNSSIKNFLIISSLFCLISKVSAGALCFPACLVFCAANPVVFQAALVSGGVSEVACLPGCGIACSMGLFVPAACFSEDSQLTVKEPNEIVSKSIKYIKRNDYVLTLNNNGSQTYTKVINNIKSNGNFKFVDIECKNGLEKKNLKVTEDHALIVENEKEKKLILAKNLKVGMKFLVDNNEFCQITQLKPIILNEKYTLLTEDGTVISSGIFSSTICDNEIDENSSFEKNLEKWKNKHNFISTKSDKVIN